MQPETEAGGEESRGAVGGEARRAAVGRDVGIGVRADAEEGSVKRNVAEAWAARSSAAIDSTTSSATSCLRIGGEDDQARDAGGQAASALQPARRRAVDGGEERVDGVVGEGRLVAARGDRRR